MCKIIYAGFNHQTFITQHTVGSFLEKQQQKKTKQTNQKKQGDNHFLDF